MKLIKQGYNHVYGSNYLVYAEKIGKDYYYLKVWVEVDAGLEIAKLVEKAIQRQFDKKRLELFIEQFKESTKHIKILR